MKNRFFLKVKNTLFETIFHETPLLKFTSPSKFSNKTEPYVYTKSNLYNSNHHLLMKPFKSICREI